MPIQESHREVENPDRLVLELGCGSLGQVVEDARDSFGVRLGDLDLALAARRDSSDPSDDNLVERFRSVADLGVVYLVRIGRKVEIPGAAALEVHELADDGRCD